MCIWVICNFLDVYSHIKTLFNNQRTRTDLFDKSTIRKKDVLLLCKIQNLIKYPFNVWLPGAWAKKSGCSLIRIILINQRSSELKRDFSLAMKSRETRLEKKKVRGWKKMGVSKPSATPWIKAVGIGGRDQIGSRDFHVPTTRRCVSHPNRRISFPSYARIRFCFRRHHWRINGELLVTATLRLLCADKLRETRLRRARQSVWDEGEKSRIRISVCLFRGSVKNAGWRERQRLDVGS